jgi:hypothetical protein
MAYENTADIAGELMSEDPAAQEMELQRKRAEERAALLAMQQIENQVASPAAVSGPTPLQMEVSQGRMYMGPNDGPALKEFEARQGPFTGPSKVVNLMPPPTGPAPTRLQELQALDRPPDATGFGRSKTLSIRPADPFSDASVAHARNAAVYDAVMKIRANAEAGIPSPPELQALAMSGGATGGLTPAQAAAAADRRRAQDWREQQAEAQTMSETVDAVESIPATPGTPERRGFWGGRIPAVPPTPAVPGHGKLTVTKKIMPPAASEKMREFKTEAEAIRSGVKGVVIINGRKAKID